MKSTDWLHRRILPDWALDESPDLQHPHKRRFTPPYIRKKGFVKSVWIGSGLLMILVATPALVLALAMGTTFLSFAILDETT